MDEVVVIDPSDPCPVGFNPLAFREYGEPALIADSILSVLKEIWSDSWGVRIADVLNAALLTLVQVEGATLLWLPALLTDDASVAGLPANSKTGWRCAPSGNSSTLSRTRSAA